MRDQDLQLEREKLGDCLGAACGEPIMMRSINR
jgi:hypothetical protein